MKKGFSMFSEVGTRRKVCPKSVPLYRTTLARPQAVWYPLEEGGAKHCSRLIGR